MLLETLESGSKPETNTEPLAFRPMSPPSPAPKVVESNTPPARISKSSTLRLKSPASPAPRVKAAIALLASGFWGETPSSCKKFVWMDRLPPRPAPKVMAANAAPSLTLTALL